MAMSNPRPCNEQPIVRDRMPELDVVRGIAILAVLFFHGFGDSLFIPIPRPAWQRFIMDVAGQGWAGVNLFFVLSGFLITGILIDSAGRPDYYSRFYLRRALRILPAYYLMLVVILAWRFATGTPGRTVAEFGALSVIYLSNVSALFGVDFLYPLLWSLSVEEHFYLLWPALVRNLSRRGLAVTAALICVIEPALRLYDLSHGGKLWWAGSHHGGAYVYTWMMADGLALGALLALLGRSRWSTRRNFFRLAGVTAAISVAATAASVFVSKPLGLCLRGTVVNYFALALIAGALWLGTGAHSRWVKIPVLAFYGYISYGLYLVHDWIAGVYYTVLARFAPDLLPNLDFAKIWLAIVVIGAVSTGVAYLSRVTYEEFFLRMKPGAQRAREATGATAAA
jgi:peptidoglycan/LPS O-acetylase OafA/YrhL